MSFFEIVGQAVVGAAAIMFIGFIILLIINFIGYQKGARNMRDYAYSGPVRSQWFWTKHGVKRWLRSFKHGGGWHVETADPEDDNYDLRIYENGTITRHPTRYSA